MEGTGVLPDSPPLPWSRWEGMAGSNSPAAGNNSGRRRRSSGVQFAELGPSRLAWFDGETEGRTKNPMVVSVSPAVAGVGGNSRRRQAAIRVRVLLSFYRDTERGEQGWVRREWRDAEDGVLDLIPAKRAGTPRAGGGTASPAAVTRTSPPGANVLIFLQKNPPTMFLEFASRSFC